MSDIPPERRRSRIGWEIRTEPATTPAGTHDHGQRNGPLFVAFGCIIGLVAINVGLVIFILVRGAARDASEQRMREEISDSWCEALDGLPAENYFLDGLRVRHECGPGRPVEDLPPEVQRELNGSARPVPPPPLNVAPGEPTPSGGVAPPAVDPGDIPAPEPQREPVPAPQPVPEPTPQPDPLVDLTPLTEPVTDLLCPIICISEE